MGERVNLAKFGCHPRKAGELEGLSALNRLFFSSMCKKMSATCIHTHNVFQLLFFNEVSSFLGNGCEQEGVLHEALHRHCQKVLQLETMALWLCLTPLWVVGKEWKG